MADYTTFDQILKDRKGTPERRTAFLRKWLQRTYGIDYDLNPGYFEELARIHDHDGQPLHFGQVTLASQLGAVLTRLAHDDRNRWVILVATKPDFSDAEPLDRQQDANLKDYIALLENPPLPPTRTAPTGKYGYLEGVSPYAVTLTSGVSNLSPVDPANIPAWLFVPDSSGE